MQILAGALTALWLGVLTSISPCPLATNIVAVSFIGKRLGSPGRVLLSGLLYTAGRVLTYVVLGAIVVAGLLSIPVVSTFLQKYMNKLLGPILILAGMFLLELLKFSLPGFSAPEKLQKRVERGGVWGAGLLGIVFALSFCPISAALFFGSLVPLSVHHRSEVLLPLLYGVGTGLPVIVFAFMIALGMKAVSRAFSKISRIEAWARRITGVVFIVVGVYYCLRYIFAVHF